MLPLWAFFIRGRKILLIFIRGICPPSFNSSGTYAPTLDTPHEHFFIRGSNISFRISLGEYLVTRYMPLCFESSVAYVIYAPKLDTPLKDDHMIHLPYIYHHMLSISHSLSLSFTVSLSLSLSLSLFSFISSFLLFISLPLSILSLPFFFLLSSFPL